jgi:hypothetical protein
MQETKLNVGDIILIYRETWGLTQGQKYIVDRIRADKHGTKIYNFKSNRKNATTITSVYAEYIDSEINEKSTSEIEIRLELVFAKSIFIVR